MTDKPVSSLELAEEMIALDAETLTAADTAQLQRLILDYARSRFVAEPSPGAVRCAPGRRNNAPTAPPA